VRRDFFSGLIDKRQSAATLGERPISKRALGEAIVKRRPKTESAKGTGGIRFYEGISLTPTL
jgi:hypothetical protein